MNEWMNERKGYKHYVCIEYRYYFFLISTKFLIIEKFLIEFFLHKYILNVHKNLPLVVESSDIVCDIPCSGETKAHQIKIYSVTCIELVFVLFSVLHCLIVICMFMNTEHFYMLRRHLYCSWHGCYLIIIITIVVVAAATFWDSRFTCILCWASPQQSRAAITKWKSISQRQ